MVHSNASDAKPLPYPQSQGSQQNPQVEGLGLKGVNE